jgi:hypothetical protein
MEGRRMNRARHWQGRPPEGYDRTQDVEHFEPEDYERRGEPFPIAPQFREGQQEHPIHDTLRWGDGDVVKGIAVPPTPIGNTAISGLGVGQISQQLVRTHSPRPIVWLLQVNVEPGCVQMPPGETANVTLSFVVTVGCGQSRTTYVAVQVPLVVANGYQLLPGTQPAPFSLPAGDLQVVCFAQYTPTRAGNYAFPVAAMVAPWANLPGGERTVR